MKYLSTLAELAGLAAVVAGVWITFSLGPALIVGGVSLVGEAALGTWLAATQKGGSR